MRDHIPVGEQVNGKQRRWQGEAPRQLLKLAAAPALVTNHARPEVGQRQHQHHDQGDGDDLPDGRIQINDFQRVRDTAGQPARDQRPRGIDVFLMEPDILARVLQRQTLHPPVVVGKIRNAVGGKQVFAFVRPAIYPGHLDIGAGNGPPDRQGFIAGDGARDSRGINRANAGQDIGQIGQGCVADLDAIGRRHRAQVQQAAQVVELVADLVKIGEAFVRPILGVGVFQTFCPGKQGLVGFAGAGSMYGCQLVGLVKRRGGDGHRNHQDRQEAEQGACGSCSKCVQTDQLNSPFPWPDGPRCNVCGGLPSR